MAQLASSSKLDRRSHVTRGNRPNLGVFLFFAVSFGLSAYFTFAAIQGDYGLFRRVEIQSESASLERDLQKLVRQIHEMENLTQRLSDDYLDLDLLDEQARSVLGLVRPDELVIR